MQIGPARLASQQISYQPHKCANEVVQWLGALQAQDYTGALWSIGLRMEHSSEQIIEQAIAERKIIRTWPLRGTLHFVAADDVRWILRLLTPRTITKSAGRCRQLELDEQTFSLSQAVFARVLQGGKQLSRDELYGELEQTGISTVEQRGYHLLVRAAQDGLICFGVPRNKEQTFTLLDEWIPPTPADDLQQERDEGLARLAQRYFSSHGPATLQDFAGWADITLGDAKRGLEAVRTQFICERVSERDFWFSADQVDCGATRDQLFLLPGFDEYILGYKDRSDVLESAYSNHICPGGNGVFSPTIVLNGQVVGTWKRVTKKGKIEIIPSPFQSISPTAIEMFESASMRYLNYLNKDAPCTV